MSVVLDVTPQTNKDGSPTTVYSPAYKEKKQVDCWFDYFFYKNFDGENYERANAIANLQIYRLNN